MRRWRGLPRIVLVAAGVVLLGGLVWVLGPGAAWVLAHFDGVTGLAGKDLAAALDAIRGRALTIATGLIALVAVYYTARNADTARQGHITDRYTKAIEQLGSDKLDIRLGGIYALERIARDSARDHPTVIEVLAAFIRENSPLPAPDGPEGAGEPPPAKLRTDVQAALTVIGRRTLTHDLPMRRIKLTGAYLNEADLTSANLTRADLTGTHLTRANLLLANLGRAHLTNANLTRANLGGANLTHARLTNADLANANLSSADLTRANLMGAKLTGAYLNEADLTSAYLAGADLTDADLSHAKLTGADLSYAKLTGAKLTELPGGGAVSAAESEG
ncbi:pentapeptide repeat-containing protein [Sphaerisporangium sp. NPDC005288]|uniref:pentapeptide repeat-containing protein n=1 Tax=Sphaerisporangium sp. NPDC005288 TaxID=3155114 RepID=UPI0033BC3128